MQKFILLLLDQLSFLYKKSDIDYEQLRSIVKIKFEINSRKASGMLGQSASGKPTSFTFALVIYAVFGLVTAFVLFLQNSALISYGILYSYILVFTIMVLITDFSSVLLDTSDNTIVLPKPVSSKTVFAARNTFIIVYIAQIVLALSAGGIIITFILFGGLAGLLFLTSLILITLLATNLTFALYLGVMSFTSEETMKNAINYMQIAMTVLFMGSYQLLPRLIDNLENFTQQLNFETWMIFIPPFWYATMQGLLQHQIEIAVLPLLSVVLGIVMPFGLMVGIQKFFIPFFNNKLQDLAIQNKEEKSKKTQTVHSAFSPSFVLKKLFQLKPLEQAAYVLTVQSLKADRKLKLRIYPALGYIVVFIIIIFVSVNKNNENLFVDLHATHHYLWLIYFCGFLLNTAQFETSYSENFKARWIYESSVIQHPGQLISGSLKANQMYFMVPAYVLVSIGVLFFWGPSTADDLVLGFFNCSLITLINIWLNQRLLPFSLPEDARMSGNNFARGLLIMVIIAALCGLHYLAILVPYGVSVAIVIFFASYWFVLNKIQHLGWKQITTQ